MKRKMYLESKISTTLQEASSIYSYTLKINGKTSNESKSLKNAGFVYTCYWCFWDTAAFYVKDDPN